MGETSSVRDMTESRQDVVYALSSVQPEVTEFAYPEAVCSTGCFDHMDKTDLELAKIFGGTALVSTAGAAVSAFVVTGATAFSGWWIVGLIAFGSCSLGSLTVFMALLFGCNI